VRDVPKEQILERIRFENPWWRDPSSIGATYRAYRPRPYLELLFPLIASREPKRAVVLLGPRRVGKTVMMHHAIQRLLDQGTAANRITYVSVDHPIYNGLGLEELARYSAEAAGSAFPETGAFLFFDEIQYRKDWELHLKHLVDGYPGVKFLASGSAAAALRLKSNESGAGRFTDFLLPPLTFHEYVELLGETPPDPRVPTKSDTPLFDPNDIVRLNELFVDYLNFGGYPEVALSKEIQADPSRFVKNDIIDKVLLRDLPSLYGIQDIQELNSLFTTLAYNTAGEVSLEQLSQRSGVAKNTIKRYVEYLEAAFLVKVVHRVDRTARHFERKHAFKIYLTNPSIRTAVFAPVKVDDPAVGHLAETAVFAQWFHSDIRLHYARWNGGEVDIVALKASGAGASWAVEVKWSDRCLKAESEVAPLVAFCRENALSSAVVTTLTAHGRLDSAGVVLFLVPTSVYCYTVGRNLIEGRILDLQWGPEGERGEAEDH